MKESAVQIVVPIYNGEKTLHRCLDSLKSQTFTDWQAILVDDASVDSSAEIAKSYAAEDDRFVLIMQEKNSGVSRARNKALTKISDSEYTAFLDCDDYWEPDMLEVMYTKAKKNNCDVVQCRFIYDFENGQQVLPAGAFKKECLLTGKALRKVYRRMMTGINMNHVCMKLMRTELIQGMEFDTGIKTAEDLVFCIELFKKVKSYIFLPIPMYHYSRSSTSLTGNSLSVKQKLDANRYAAKVMKRALPVWEIDNIAYRMLVNMRAYLIMVSKVFRTLREKITVNGGVKHGK